MAEGQGQGAGCDPSRASAPGSRATEHLVPAGCGPGTFPRGLLWPPCLYAYPSCVQSRLHSRHLLFFIQSHRALVFSSSCWRMRGLTRLCAPTPWVLPSRPGVIWGLYPCQSPRQPQGTGWGQPCGARKGHRGPAAGTFSSRDVVLVSEPLSTRWVSLLICGQRSRPSRALSAVETGPSTLLRVTVTAERFWGNCPWQTPR